MKNKKLFAILTLVCFMFTLMPVAAFAAPAETTISTPAYGHVATGDDVVDLNENVGLVSTVTGSFYVYAVKDGALAPVTAVGTATQVGKVALVDITAAGAALDVVKFAKPGSYELFLASYKGAPQQAIVANADYAKTDAEVLAFLDGFKEVAMYNNAVKVGEVEAVYAVHIQELDGSEAGAQTVDADNGFDVVRLQVQVTNNGYGVPNAEVDLYTDSYGLQVTKIDAKTNAAGIAKFMVTGSVPSGLYPFNVYAAYEDASDKVAVSVRTLGAATVTATEPKAPVNKGVAASASGIEFRFAGENGEAISTLGTLGTDYKVACVAAPAGYDKTQTFDLTSIDTNVFGISGTALNYEGDYTFKVSLKNGASATASVTVKKFDKPVAIQFDRAPKTVALGATDADVAPYGVLAVDANGVTTAVTPSYSVNGKAVVDFDVVSGTTQLDVNGDEDYIGSTITVLAVYTYNNQTFTTSNELTVTDSAAVINYNTTEAEVGANSTLTAVVLDANGKKVELADDARVQVIVLDKPANAVVSASGVYNTTKDIIATNVLASAPGEYKIQTIVTYNSGANYISGIDTIVVGGVAGQFNDVVVVSMGANAMIVNNEVVTLEVAPFIENNRTMLQYNVLYVFGIDVDWVPETSSVVAEGNGIKVVMTLGSKVAVVNGEEVALDVAPYVVNGRTVVPAGFITGTFGITPTFTYNADGTIADILFTK